MSTYDIYWGCCGNSSQTDAWAPDTCPFCELATAIDERRRLRVALAASSDKAAVIVAAAIALRQAFADYLEEPAFCTESCYKGAQLILDEAIKAGEATEEEIS